MQMKDLKVNPRNPRKMSAKKLTMLKASVEKFGDLSGFVFNVRTKQLIGGHQKKKVIPPDSTIKIEKKYDTPTQARTVAEGYVLINGERWKYREVDAEPVWEVEALLAANKHQGDWDTDLLRLTLADHPKLNLDAAGFELTELKAMGIEPLNVQIAALTPPPSFAAMDQDNEEPKEEVEEQETDEEYVKNTPETTEQIDVQSFGGGEPAHVDSSKAFEKVEEKKMDVVGRRFVIIIDCKNDEVKQALREKIRSHVEESGSKFF
jgi:hypothetical protein